LGTIRRERSCGGIVMQQTLPFILSYSSEIGRDRRPGQYGDPRRNAFPRVPIKLGRLFTSGCFLAKIVIL
jgi:hypothetical protein